MRKARPGKGGVQAEKHYLLDPLWSWVAVAMAALLVLAGSISWSLPSILSLCIAALAIGIVSSARWFVALEKRFDSDSWERFPVLAGAVGLPMALYGFAVARWTYRLPSLEWDLSVAILVLVGLCVTAALNGRLPSILSAQLSLWLGASFFGGNIVTSLLLLSGFAATMWFSVIQTRNAIADAARQSELLHAQRRAEELLREYETTGQGWFWETDRRGSITYVSPTVCRTLGRKASSLLGRPLTDLFILEANENESERTLTFHLSTRSSFQDLAVRAATDTEERWWSITGRPVHDEYKNFLGFRGSGSDLTEKRRSQEHASRLAHYDSLTGLANRFQMSEMLAKILNAPRLEQRSCAIFLLDLDRFKQVNDTLGHPAGDALLKQVSQRLQTTVGEEGRVGRLGGDEFKVILPGKIAHDHLSHIATRIIESLSHPYSIEGHRVSIGASLGIALCPENGTTSEDLIRNADLALYAAKDGGRGRHHFYAEDLHSEAEERRQLEQDLQDALATGGLELHYQPVVKTRTEVITGFEALLRWNHPRLGPLSPAKFVPIAEDAGLITQIGEWALRTACSDLARWPESVRVAVNVSPLQFANPALPSVVTNALAASQVNPDRLELEITESVFLDDNHSTEAMFAALKRVGVRLALDDFGTGYSSLGYLKKAPFDKIKIDQGFVRGATIKGSRNGAIIASIVSLAESLDMETTAEGVETFDELELVRALGCSHVQGYIYERPMSGEKATERLSEGLVAEARGPKSARAPRQTMLRKVLLEHRGQRYNGTIRNISESGAMVEGLWNVPVGTVFNVHLSKGYQAEAVTRWCKDDRLGLEFRTPLELDTTGAVSFASRTRVVGREEAPVMRKAG
ncbi:GGDEF domain-containing protein [Novosphingobium marinum]|uniref:Diguanylate cyclase (GGDEF)-like protein/PAS domain S-box-containing protein n=2 Tax=Novosphingobium marinum TaxID=1514948 RepID=A0A7Y9XV88_9SPHN|nr:EAL domain-containing protein [Novosphingobium marinum]NYH93878.1 diguanylate cyclase (GGDEF)-like protein/PAS domain S-box-containing protein [Novosphingobium marinum]GGC17972.1 GGDEF domain-containing protein [Novosphingobium marinum]